MVSMIYTKRGAPGQLASDFLLTPRPTWSLVADGQDSICALLSLPIMNDEYLAII